MVSDKLLAERYTHMEELAKQHLTAILDSLGFQFEIEIDTQGEITTLHISSSDAKLIIGEDGERLDDLQYMVNRMVHCSNADAPRVKIDCDHYREQTEENLISKAIHLAEKALDMGKPMRMKPLNAYHRRLVHNALQEVEGVTTESEEGNARYKRITIVPN